MLRQRTAVESQPALPGEPRPAGTWGGSDWDGVADLFLQRVALVARVQRDRSPDPLAGLKVDDADLGSLLRELPGLDEGDPTTASGIEARLAEPLCAARERLLRSLAGDGDLARLVRSAHLGALEAEVLAVLCAVEADPRRQRLVAYLNDDVTQRHLTLWSLGSCFGWSEELVVALGPSGGLRRAALLAPQADGPWSAAPIAVASAVMWLLGSGRSLDHELPPGTELYQRAAGGGEPLVVAAGPDRRRRLEAAFNTLQATTFIVTTPPSEQVQWDALIRQATLSASGVVLEVDGTLSPDARDQVERAHHLSWAIASPVELALSQLFRRSWVEAEVLPAEATAAEWAAAFPEERGSRSFQLSAQQLLDVARAAQATGGDLSTAVRRLAAGHIDATATRVRPSRTWDDLVLDDVRLAQIQEVAVRHRRRGLVYEQWGFSPQPSTGVVALFAGQSGTGKTLAAEIIAGELGVDLYKVDLANLVSKYIGDTEKNLSRVFEAAEASRVVLFFDEADALLGKRSEVSDAHDRYANIEVAYLLQRLESYEGVAVLATNMANNLDPAFLRRLHVVVEFPMPQAEERRRIWSRSFPPGAPLDADLDLDRIADEIEITGGTIRNVVIRAAFLAAEASAPITLDLLLTALQREFEKLGRLASSSQWDHVFRRPAGIKGQ